MRTLSRVVGLVCAGVALSAAGASAADWPSLELPSLRMPAWEILALQLPAWQLPQLDFGSSQPVVKGNDTGGIIPWSPTSEFYAFGWADAYCKNWGKYARITGVHRQYGDYISFNCLWNPSVARYALPEVRPGRPR